MKIQTEFDKKTAHNSGLTQLGLWVKLQSRFCTWKFGLKSIHLANQIPN